MKPSLPSGAPAPALFPAGMIIDRVAEDADQMRELAAFWRIEQEPLEPGAYHGSILAFHTTHLQLATTFRSRSTRVRGQVPEGAVAFAVALPTKAPARFGFRALGGHEIMVARAGEEFTFQTTGECRDASVAVSVGLVEQYAASAWGEPLAARCRDGRLTLSMKTTAGEIGERLAAMIHATLQRPKRIGDEAFSRRLEQTILELLLSQVSPGVAPPPRRSKRIEYAIQANAYLLANASEPLGADLLCRQFGCSIRTLEIGFKEAFGVSLKSQLQILRLNGARRDMRATNGSVGSVKEIAMNWGFRHLGRFSVTYRKWFGESPRETLKR